MRVQVLYRRSFVLLQTPFLPAQSDWSTMNTVDAVLLGAKRLQFARKLDSSHNSTNALANVKQVRSRPVSQRKISKEVLLHFACM